MRLARDVIQSTSLRIPIIVNGKPRKVGLIVGVGGDIASAIYALRIVSVIVGSIVPTMESKWIIMRPHGEVELRGGLDHGIEGQCQRGGQSPEPAHCWRRRDRFLKIKMILFIIIPQWAVYLKRGTEGTTYDTSAHLNSWAPRKRVWRVLTLHRRHKWALVPEMRRKGCRRGIHGNWDSAT